MVVEFLDKKTINNTINSKIVSELVPRKWDLAGDKKLIKAMFDAKMHIGHQTKNWNPKMGPYICAKRNGIYIINIVNTLFQIEQVAEILNTFVSQGKKVLFVGTQKHVTGIISKTATNCNSFFVNQKWLGGMLTNWKTIRSSVFKLVALEKLEQSGRFEQLPKKQALECLKEKERLTKYLLGLKGMTLIPKILIIVGQISEMNAVREWQKLSQKLDIINITMVDTNCDPSLADFVIPSNDDSVKSVQIVMNTLGKAIQKGQQNFKLNEFSTKKNKFSKNFL